MHIQLVFAASQPQLDMPNQFAMLVQLALPYTKLDLLRILPFLDLLLQRVSVEAALASELLVLLVVTQAPLLAEFRP